jgi:hypothetical protein
MSSSSITFPAKARASARKSIGAWETHCPDSSAVSAQLECTPLTGPRMHSDGQMSRWTRRQYDIRWRSGG